MRIAATLLCLGLLLAGCTDANVKPLGGRLYSVDEGSFYIRCLYIDGASVYFLSDANGRPVGGATARYSAGKATRTSASLMVEDPDFQKYLELKQKYGGN